MSEIDENKEAARQSRHDVKSGRSAFSGLEVIAAIKAIVKAKKLFLYSCALPGKMLLLRETGLPNG